MKVSVIIPAYNVEKYINRSLNSVFKQTFQPFEIIIVDDGSTDNTAKIVEKFKDKVVYIYQKNAGSSSARNLGIIKAKGDWIAFLDSDDEWIDTHLFNFVETYSLYPSIKWYGAPFKMLDEISRKIIFEVKKGHIKDANCHTTFEDYMTAFPPKAYLSSPTMIINKMVFDDVGVFNVQKKTAVDVDMWFRIALSYPQIGYTYKEGAIVYRRPSSLSTLKKWNPLKTIKRIIECEQLAAKHSEASLKRIELRTAYWVSKLIKGAVKNEDLKTLKLIKKNHAKNLSKKFRLILFFTTNFPFVIKLKKFL